ncbi:MAG: arylsulfatase [Candidatus Sumerlaeota bacterium]
MPHNRPNILLIMTDEQRGDCLGIEQSCPVQTPYLDNLAESGFWFRRAYTACPVCIPARRTLMTGQKPASHGVLMNYNTHMERPTLPGELTKAGYHTHLVGKLHLHPRRKLYGFMSAAWDDSPLTGGDYMRWLRRKGVQMLDPGHGHGSDQNGWVARPWHLDETLHFSNWCAEEALNFYERRDPTRPFFLKVSFHQPHAPCTPPQVYWDRYINMDLPEPYVGDWAKISDEPQPGTAVTSWRTHITPAQMKQYRAGYYGVVNHIDDQIARILRHTPGNTVIIFCSDHGEMLGDHHWIRKRNAFEPSARVPFIMKFPNGMGIKQGRQIHELVELMDIMPTVLDMAGVEIPETVDGRSLMPLLRGETNEWRKYLHGECADVPSMNSGMQYITDERYKYIWYPGSGLEHLFDLKEDPREMHNLAGKPDQLDRLRHYREILARELEGRPEGFVKDGKLQTLGGNTPFFLPEYENTGDKGSI